MTMDTEKTTQVHRHHDTVAIYVGFGQTVYLSPEQAKKLSLSLEITAEDIEACKFTESRVGIFYGQTL